MRILPVFLAALLVSAGAVPVTVMAVETPDIEGLDIVDATTLWERSPILSELRSRGASEEEIAEAIVNMPRVSYIGGWTEADDKRITPLLQLGRGPNYSMHGETGSPTENGDCIEEQPPDRSEPLHITLSEPLSLTDAIIVALSRPGVARTIEDDLFYISAGTMRVSTPREEQGFKEYLHVEIDRFDSATHEALETFSIYVNYDGSVYKVDRLPPGRVRLLPVRADLADDIGFE